MIREFKEGMANMYSLMERMDKHMTISQAEYNKESYLDEAISTGSGKLEPNVLMTIDEDNSNKTRVLKVFVGPLFPQDWKKLESVYDCDHLKYNGMDGVIFNKSLPFKKDARKKKADNSANQPTVQSTPVQAQAQPAAPAKGLLGKLRAKQSVNEGLLSKLQAKQTAAAPQQTVQSQASNNAATQPTQQTVVNTNGVDDSIVNWFTKTFIPAMKMISNNQNYERAHMSNLMDVNYLIDQFLVAPEKTDANYNEESAEEIKKTVAEAIKSGDWSAIANVFSPVNLQAIIFGNVLTGRNQRMIQRQANEYGLQVGDPDYPTNLYAPGKWIKKFGRRVLPDAKYKYYTMSPRMNDRGTRVNFGSKGHYDEFGSDLKGFQPAYLYNISDTEKIPASEYEKYGLNPKKMDPNVDYFSDIPGLSNNLTGELNQHAIKQKEEALAAQQAALSADQTQLLNEIQSDDGKAKVFNDALLKYAENIDYKGQPMVDVRNSSNILIDYAKNIVSLCDYLLVKLRYNNPTLSEPLKMISAFAIACKTTGANEVLSLFGQRITDTRQLLSDWDNACGVTLQAVTATINFMVKYLMNKYAKFNDGSVQQAQATVSNSNAGAASTLSESTNNIEFLLEELIR